MPGPRLIEYVPPTFVYEELSLENLGCTWALSRAQDKAHVRRRFWDLREEYPVADELIAHILELYRVEYEAERLNIVGTPEHKRLRRSWSLPVLFAIRMWLRHHRRLHSPKSAFGQALAYAWKNFRSLMTFLRDPRIRLDNNASELALRPAALGRKTYLFVGDNEAGTHLAVLMSLVASAAANGHNAEEYLADVLLRVATQPARLIDDLLPHRWSPTA